MSEPKFCTLKSISYQYQKVICHVLYNQNLNESRIILLYGAVPPNICEFPLVATCFTFERKSQKKKQAEFECFGGVMDLDGFGNSACNGHTTVSNEN